MDTKDPKRRPQVAPVINIPDPGCAAVALDRQADIQLQHGYHAAAERLAHRAAELRECLA